MIVALLIKPALVLGAAWLLTTLLRNRSAAARHAVWAGAIVATLVLPVPLPRLEIPAPATASARSLMAPALLNTTSATPRLPNVLLITWLAGMGLFGTRRIFAQLRLHRIVRRARYIEEGLLVSNEIHSPAVAGVLRPVILLPESFPEEALHAVLIHERSHITRRDPAINLAADIAKIVYWCNPLVHLAVRRLRVESERACDDRVVLSGAEPRWYAELLLTMASARVPQAATAMARELESRLLAVLDTGVRRSTKAPAAFAALGLCLALPISALTLQDPLVSPSSERLPPVSIPASARAALNGPDSALARLLFEASTRRPEHAGDFVAERSKWALAQVRDGRLVEPMLAALDDRDWRVQSYAAWTLAVARDSRATPKLIPLLQSPNWRLRAMAAAALHASRDPSAEQAMRAALADPAWQVRIEAEGYFNH